MESRKLLLKINCLLVGILITNASFAASISGFIKQSSNRPASGAIVHFECPGSNLITANTDQYGRYRASGLPDVQWCTLVVRYKDLDSTRVKVNSGSGSKDINIKLQKNDSGWRVII